MLRQGSRRAIGVLVSTAVVALAATSATASAAQTVCVGGPGSAVMVAEADGTCKKSNTAAKTLVDQSELAALKAKVATLEDTVATLETKLSRVSFDASGLNGLPTVKIDGANLQIVSGSGATDGPVNGLGNLFIGYDEQVSDTQTGSHNLIIGKWHTFTSWGGLLAGINNSITSMASSVSGGVGNTASGPSSSVSGGEYNTASGGVSAVSGGGANTASGGVSAVSGGDNNTASGAWSSILGGSSITVSATGGTSP